MSTRVSMQWLSASALTGDPGEFYVISKVQRNN